MIQRTLLRRAAWLAAWILVAAGSYLAYKHADEVFDKNLWTFRTSKRNFSELIPDDVQYYICDQNFRVHWKSFRSLPLQGKLKTIPKIKELLEGVGLDEVEMAPWEKWILEFWGPEVSLAWSQNQESLYLISPIGDAEQCFEWLRKTTRSLDRLHVPWKSKQIGDRPCIEIFDSHFGPAKWKIQFYPVNGIAMLVMGRQADPIKKIFEVAGSPPMSLHRIPEFAQFYEEGLQQSAQKERHHLFGFARQKTGTESLDLGTTWSFDLTGDHALEFQVNLPRNSTEQVSPQAVHFVSLLNLQQKVDRVSLVSTWSEFIKLSKSGLSRLPGNSSIDLDGLDFKSMLGSYHEIWSPIFQGLNGEFFISFGEPYAFSDKIRIPFPQVVLAMPYGDKHAFLKAVEATLSKANEEVQSSLVLRKTMTERGEYYEIKLGESEWKEGLGLKELPVFSFVDQLLVIASNRAAMENILEHAYSAPREKSGVEVENIQIFVNMQQSPETIRVLLGALGMLNSKGENVFLTPRALETSGEIFEAMKAFETGTFKLSRTPTKTRLRMHLRLSDSKH